jgi:hypothetical protein
MGFHFSFGQSLVWSKNSDKKERIRAQNGGDVTDKTVFSYHDQQKHNYFANYHTPTCFDTIVSSSRQPVINILPSYTSILNAAVGNTIYNYDVTIINIFCYFAL